MRSRDSVPCLLCLRTTSPVPLRPVRRPERARREAAVPSFMSTSPKLAVAIILSCNDHYGETRRSVGTGRMAMGARTGSQFLEGLRRTKREIWVDGERIDDVTTHPKLGGGAESLAAMFDRQHAYASECLFAHPENGEPTNISHMIPRSRDDLRRRHAGLVRLPE